MAISKKFFLGNRQALRQKLNLNTDEVVIIPGSVLMQFHADQSGEFLQESNFYYLSGVCEPGCTLVITSQSEYLIIPDSDEFESLWNGQLTVEQASSVSGIDEIYGVTDGWEKLNDNLKENIKKVYTLNQPSEFIYGNIYTNPARKILVDKLAKNFPKLDVKPVSQAIAELRVIKQKPELASIEEAVGLTMKAFNSVVSSVKGGANEAEIDAKIVYDFMRTGYREAYRSIVAGGSRSCVIHYVDNNKSLKSGELLLVDAGARVNGYAADITRTVAVGANPSQRQTEVMQAVESIHDFAAGLIKPGVTFLEYEKSVTAEMGLRLHELGLIKDAKDEHQIRKYFPHATSHFLGLDVHDVGVRADIEFQPDMVLTIEPGIYIPEESIGVRFENDIQVTKSGIRNFSQDLSFSAKI